MVNSTMHIYPINGACNRVSPDATAFAYRDANFATVIAGMWPDPADNEKHIQWVKDYYAAVHPNSLAGGMSTSWPETIRIGSGTTTRGNYDRLVAIKKKYDPANLFHMNQNIKP